MVLLVDTIAALGAGSSAVVIRCPSFSSKPPLMIGRGKKPYCAVPHTIEIKEILRNPVEWRSLLCATQEFHPRHTPEELSIQHGSISVTLVTRGRAGIAGVGTEKSGV